MVYRYTGGRFVVVEEVGAGGFGSVVIARDQQAHGKRVALKTAADVSPNHQVKNELQVNWRILQQLDWSNENNIARFLDAVDVRDAHNRHSLPYLVFEEAEGWPVCEKLCRDLKSYITACSSAGISVTWETHVKQWAGQISNGLQHLHTLAIVHLDVKPSNILLCKGTRGHVLKICDFASAQMDENTPEQIACTPNYTAPEVFDPRCRPLPPACDLWSLGATLFFLLEGQAPFQAESMQAIQRRILNCDYTLGWKVPAEAKRLISSLLQPQPSQRMPLVDLNCCLGLERGMVSMTSTTTIQMKPEPLNTAGLMPKKVVWGADNVVEVTKNGEASITDKKKGRQVIVSADGQRVIFVKPDGEVRQFTYQSLPSRLYVLYNVLEHFVRHEREHTLIAKEYFLDSSAELLQNMTFIFRRRNAVGKMVERVIVRQGGSVEVGCGEKKKKFSGLQEAALVLGEAECSRLRHIFEVLAEDVRLWKERGRCLPVVCGRRPQSWNSATSVITSQS